MANFTKDSIKRTFLELLQEKPLGQITVKEITTACGINRNTFYYHYRDITALIESIMTEEANKILSAHPNIDSLGDCLETILDFVKNNRSSILHIYQSISRSVWEKYLWRTCRKLVTTYCESIKDTFSPEDYHALIDYYSATCFGLAMLWLDHGMEDHEARANLHRLYLLDKNLGNTPKMPKF